MGVSPVDTFFVGRKGNDAWYWTSHAEKKLAHNAYATCITFSGSDVYIGGGIIVDTVFGIYAGRILEKRCLYPPFGEESIGRG